MFADTKRVKRTTRRLLVLLLFLLLIAGVLTYFIVSKINSQNERNGVFVYNTIQGSDSE